MAVIAFPALVPAEIQLGLRSNVQISTSDLSGYVQTVELPGARWTLSLRMPDLLRANAALMEAYIAQLRGGANRARLPVWTRLEPLGLWEGSPVVHGASQTGNTLNVRGFDPFTSVKQGDYFNLGTNGQLLMVAADGTSDSGGELAISVEPAIRTAVADATALVSSDPVIPYAILTDPHPRWRLRPGDFAEFALDFVEVFS